MGEKILIAIEGPMLENTKSSAVITISVWLVQTPAAWAGGRISARYVQDCSYKISVGVCIIMSGCTHFIQDAVCCMQVCLYSIIVYDPCVRGSCFVVCI